MDTNQTDLNSVTSPICGFWRRIFAATIDAFCLSVVCYIIGFSFFAFFAEIGAKGRLLGLAIGFLYFGFLNSNRGKGQTLGKKILGICVVDKNGSYISLGRSFLRYAILATFGFLSGLMIRFSSLNTASGVVFTFAVMFLQTGFIYFYLFNRRTRQSLHDLFVGTYVVHRSFDKNTLLSVKMWKGHFVTFAILCLTIGVGSFVLNRSLSRMDFFKDILNVQQKLYESDSILSAQVVMGKLWDGSMHNQKKHMAAWVLWKGVPQDNEKAVQEVGRILIDANPDIKAQDSVTISVNYGFDLGLAVFRKKYVVNYTPEKLFKVIDEEK